MLGQSEWISIDDASRIQPFGKMSDPSNNNQPTDVPTPAPAAEVNTVLNDANLVKTLHGIEGKLWRENLGIGSVVDAQDKNGNWYQAVILDVILVDDLVVSVPVTSTTTPDINITVSDIFPDENISNLKKELFAKTTDHSHTCSSNNIPSDNMSRVSPINTLESKDVTESSVCDVENVVFPVPPPQQPCDIELAKKKYMARVAFLGWSEWYDEWIDMHITSQNDEDPLLHSKIQPLNSISCGHRGEVPVREEIKHFTSFLTKPYPDFVTSTQPIYAMSRDETMIAPFYADIVNTFGQNSGLHKVITMFRNFNMECGTDIGNIILANGTLDNRFRMKLNTIINIVIVISQTYEVFHLFLLKRFYDEYNTCFYQIIRFIMAYELRTTKSETLEDLINAYEMMTTANFQNKFTGAINTLPLRLMIIHDSIMSPYLNR